MSKDMLDRKREDRFYDRLEEILSPKKRKDNLDG